MAKYNGHRADDVYDMIVIGAGTGGLVASGVAGRLGKKVALIEREQFLGGDCTWFGCVPSKALIKVARVAHEARTAAYYGIKTSAPQVDMARVREYVQGAISEIYQHETPEAFSAEYNVEIILGEARFVDPHTVMVNGQTLRAKRFIIATGARPAHPPISGLDDVPYMTYKTLFENDTLPEHLLVIGSGPIGAEMAQAYARLGAQVSLIGPELLPREEPEVREVMGRVLASDGVMHYANRVMRVQREGDQIVAVLDDGAEVRGDRLLVAAGREPVVDTLDLDKAGVQYATTGIPVNVALRTNVRHIYAVGDVLGGDQFTHNSNNQGSIAAANALLPVVKMPGFEEKALPRVTYVAPEVAQVGMTEAQARDKYGDSIKAYFYPMTQGDRAVTENDTEGFIKIIHTNGKLLGATIVADRAGEMITEFTLALKNGLKLRTLARTMHAYPSYSEIVYQAVAFLLIEELFEGASGKLITRVAKVLAG